MFHVVSKTNTPIINFLVKPMIRIIFIFCAVILAACQGQDVSFECTGSTTDAGTVINCSSDDVTTPSSSSSSSSSGALDIAGWRDCTNGCKFSGLRNVAITNGEETHFRTFFLELASYQCQPSVFPGSAGLSGTKKCYVDTKSLSAPVAPALNCENRHDCDGVDLDMPIGHPGWADIIRQSVDSSTLKVTDIGAFRVTCHHSHFSYDDPLVFPGQPGAAHLHQFFGNTGVDAFSTSASLADSNGNCTGGAANKSGYWAPAVMDMTKKAPRVADEVIFYYKQGYNGATNFQVYPEGLAMISYDGYWQCRHGSTPGKLAELPVNCPGDRISLHIKFPQCWDGVNLYLPDQSHMAPARNGCPASHPVALPLITLNLRYLLKDDDDISSWRLSSDHADSAPGSTLHADWMNGWDKEINRLFVENCLNKSIDCHVGHLNDGTVLKLSSKY